MSEPAHLHTDPIVPEIEREFYQTECFPDEYVLLSHLNQQGCRLDEMIKYAGPEISEPVYFSAEEMKQQVVLARELTGNLDESKFEGMFGKEGFLEGLDELIPLLDKAIVARARVGLFVAG